LNKIIYILQKEFLQIFRNKSMLLMIFVLPIIQLLIMANAATYEIKHINLIVVDADHGSFAQQLVLKFEQSPYFEVIGYADDNEQALDALYADRCDIVVHIPQYFEKNLSHGKMVKIYCAVNAINSSKAAVVYNYAQSIISSFSRQIDIESKWKTKALKAPDIRFADWFNPHLDYKTFMVPGILVLLITLVGMVLSGLNLVREKEIGTMEQINVTPIGKGAFIIGKMLPFWIIGMVELALGMGVSLLVFNIPVEGSMILVFAFAAVYLVAVLGIGLLVSTFSSTQQQAMFLSWFFIVVFILMSGLFTPIESMPLWAQKLTLINPIAYFVKVMRMVMLKGSTLYNISGYLLAMAGFAIGFNLLAILNYRKTST